MAVLLGQQTPRILVTPPAAYTCGDDAVEFARRIGVPLDLWQQLGVRNGMGRNADGTWSAFEVCVICQRQNGKGSVTDVVELYALFVLGLPVIIHSAHRLETSRKAFRIIKGIIERNPDLARRVKPINPSDEHIETIAGCRLEFRTRSGSGGRGLTCDLLILDEALELTEEQIAAIVPTLAALPGAQLWYTSTVPQFGEQHLCKVRANAIEGAPRLAYVEWGVDRGATAAETLRILGDPVAHAAANPAYGTRLLPERLVDLRRILGDAKFATECLGIWPEMAAGAVLSPARWRAMLDAGSKRVGPVALALDVTPMRDHGTIGLVGERADGLEHLQLLDYRPGTAWMVARAAEWKQVLGDDLVCFVVDAKNGAASLLDDLRGVGITVPDDPDRPSRGDVLVLDAAATSAATGQFIDAFRAEPVRFRHVGQEPADTAVENVKVRQIGDAGQIAWGRKLSEVDIGPVVAFTGARYGRRLWLNLPSKVIELVGSLMA